MSNNFMPLSSFPETDAILPVPINTTISFQAFIAAHIPGVASASWSFVGLIRRHFLPESTTLIDLNAINISADPLFSESYIDIDADISVGALKIHAGFIPNYDIHWDASIHYAEVT